MDITDSMQGFKIAFTFYEALSMDKPEPVFELDKTIGQVKVYQWTWDDGDFA